MNSQISPEEVTARAQKVLEGLENSNRTKNLGIIMIQKGNFHGCMAEQGGTLEMDLDAYLSKTFGRPVRTIYESVRGCPIQDVNLVMSEGIETRVYEVEGSDGGVVLDTVFAGPDCYVAALNLLGFDKQRKNYKSLQRGLREIADKWGTGSC